MARRTLIGLAVLALAGGVAPETLAASAPRRLSDRAESVDVAGSVSGHAAIVWSQPERGGGRTVWIVRRGPRQRFGRATEISPPVVMAGDPDVAMDPRGNAVAVYTDPFDGGAASRLWIVRCPAKAACSSPEPLTAERAGIHVDTARVAVRADGRAVVAWAERATSSSARDQYASQRTGEVYAAEETQRGAFDPPQDLGRASGASLLLAAGGGRVVAAWLDDVSEDLVARVSDGFGPFRAAETLDATKAGRTFGPVAAVDAGGTAWVAWGSHRDNLPYAFLASSAPRAPFGRAVNLGRADRAADVGSLSTGRAGELAFTWSRFRGSLTRLRTALRRPGAALRVVSVGRATYDPFAPSAPRQVLARPSSALRSDGSLAVTWLQETARNGRAVEQPRIRFVTRRGRLGPSSALARGWDPNQFGYVSTTLTTVAAGREVVSAWNSDGFLETAIASGD